MRRFLSLLSVLVGLGLIFAAIPDQNASAEGDPAIVIKDGNCFIPGVGADGSFDGAPGGLGELYRKVENGNKVTLHCHGEVTNDSGQGQSYRGIDCGVSIPSTGGFVVTTDTPSTWATGGGSNWMTGASSIGSVPC